MTDWRFPYPPPWQDIATLEAHVCTHRETIRMWVRLYGFPPPICRGKKELWQWREVDSWLANNPDIVADAKAEGIRHAVREAVNGR